MPNALHIQALSKTFNKANNPAIQIESLTIEEGKTLAIVGESGSGKTTLSRIISGLETPDSGEVFISQVLVNSDAVFVAPEQREVGLVFQDYALFPHLTVFDNVAYGVSSDNKKAAVSELLNLAELSGLEQRYPHQLSGGQQQRVALIRALAPNPKLLILDEPFSNLDVVLREQLRNTVFDILSKTKVTSIFVTHDTQDALAIADTILVLKDGQAVQYGTAKTIYKQPKTPYVARLFGDIVMLSESDLNCFSYKNTSKNNSYAIRLLDINVGDISEYSTTVNVVKSVFQGKHYLNEGKLSNGTSIHFYSFSEIENQVTIGFKNDHLLGFE